MRKTAGIFLTGRKREDIARLREKNLLREFEGYMTSKGKLKLFRSEAIRAGFSRLWKEKNYKAIVESGRSSAGDNRTGGSEHPYVL